MVNLARKIMIVVGTRPNFIKITQFQKEFDRYPGMFEYCLVHTGQHYDTNMSRTFFEQLKIKKPDYYLGVMENDPTLQLSEMIKKLGKVYETWQPDLVISPGDVTSTLAAALTANKMNIQFAHLESGLRSFDRAMPEEHNRLLADTLADYHLVSESAGALNLSNENKSSAKMLFAGNTMIDTLVAFDEEIVASSILTDLKLEKKEFALLTMHRPSNVDSKESLEHLLKMLNKVAESIHIVFSVHPRTQKQLEKHKILDGFVNKDRLTIVPPLDYFSFQKLIASCKFVLTDSGGIQEETTFRRVPCLTLRENTERPSTTTKGSNTLVGSDLNLLETNIDLIMSGEYKVGTVPHFWDGKATQRIVKWFCGPIQFYNDRTRNEMKTGRYERVFRKKITANQELSLVS